MISYNVNTHLPLKECSKGLHFPLSSLQDFTKSCQKQGCSGAELLIFWPHTWTEHEWHNQSKVQALKNTREICHLRKSSSNTNFCSIEKPTNIQYFIIKLLNELITFATVNILSPKVGYLFTTRPIPSARKHSVLRCFHWSEPLFWSLVLEKDLASAGTGLQCTALLCSALYSL